MLNAKLWFQSFVHSRTCSVDRVVNVVDAHRTGAPCLDDYEFLRTLGSGATATVYLVREKHTSHLYALKAVNKYTSEGRKIAFSTVRNEQAALTKLSGNDFILPLHTCFHDNDNDYLVMDHIPGGDLQGLRGERPLDAKDVQFYMAELLLAIEHIHAHNIVHRDLKPENVFIDTDGHIVLGDFGSSWLFDDTTPNMYLTRGCVGIPAFPSSEVLFGEDYSFEADLWAFGVIMYEMLASRDFFQTNIVPNDDPTWLRHLAERVICDEPVMVENSLMTEVAFDLVNQLLRKNPDSRLTDITEIKQHPYFWMIDWTSVTSRSLTPPWVPRLVSTRQLGVHFSEPDAYPGDQCASGNDPLPTFTFRSDSNSVSPASVRRQQTFGVLGGCAPLVSWVDGSACVGEVITSTPERQRSLKTLSRRVKRALNRPVRYLVHDFVHRVRARGHCTHMKLLHFHLCRRRPLKEEL